MNCILSLPKLEAVGASDYSTPTCVTAWMIGQKQLRARDVHQKYRDSRQIKKYCLDHHSSSQGENAEDDNCQPASFHRKADWSKAVGGNQQPPFLHRNVNRSFNLTSSRIWDPATVLLHNDQQSEFLLCTCRHFTQF